MSDLFNFPSDLNAPFNMQGASPNELQTSYDSQFNTGGGNLSSGNWITDLPNMIGNAFNSVLQGAGQVVGQQLGQAVGNFANGVPQGLGITSPTQATPIPTTPASFLSNPNNLILIGIALVVVVLLVRE